MQQSFTSSSACRWAFWVALLCVGLLIRYYLSNRFNDFVGEFVTHTSMVVVLSIIYLRFLLPCTNQSKDGEEALPYHLSNTYVSGDKIKEPATRPTLPKHDYAQPKQQLPKRRLYYLDNVKIFLTILVVSHHVTCAFGGCPGGKGWFLIVGIYDNTFRPFAQAFQLLNQGYFMSLFFFMSAYFVPSSFERKGRTEFLKDKAKRYWIPAFFVCFILTPLGIGYCRWYTGQNIIYFPAPLHTWFLYWLLLLNLAYVHIYGEDNRIDEARVDNEDLKLPGPFVRTLFYGLGICGVGMLVVLSVVGSLTFSGMPMGPGSLTNDLLFFVAGTVAKKHGWLERSLKEQIGIPIIVLRCIVIVEAAIMIYFHDKGQKIEIYYTPVVIIIGGIYCVDMSLVVLEFFQAHFDFQHRYTKFFSEAAYTVYIIHPVFVIGVSSLWIKVYEFFTGQEFEWVAPFFYSSTPIDGGALTLGLSWLLSNILVHLLVWPCAWYVRKLPGLRQIL